MQGFTFAPPTNADWTKSNDGFLVHVRSDTAGPGGRADQLLVETYLLTAPGVINQTFVVDLGDEASGSFAYSAGNGVGARVAWNSSFTGQLSGYSSEKILTF